MPKRNSKFTIALLALFLAILVSGSSSITSATAGQWRLISPTEYTLFPASDMHGVFLISGGTSGKGSGNGWAVSDNGFIFFWDGFSWNQANSPTTCQLDAVNFGGPLNPLSNGVQTASGWIVGGAISLGASAACMAATNAVSLYWNGVNWASYPVPKTGATAEMESVFLVRSASSPSDSVNAFAVGQDGAGTGAFWQWNGVPGNGGGWTEVLPTVAAPVNSVYMTHCSGSPCGGDDGIAVGNGGTIFRFVGGLWTPLASPVVGTNLNGVAMSSQTRGWAVGNLCKIIQTTDGSTWTGPVTPVGCTQHLRSIVLLSSSEGWAVGDSDVSGIPALVHGTALDSSPVWTLIPSNQITPNGIASGVGLNSVTFATSGGNVWAVGARGVAAFCQNNCNSVSGAIWSTTTSPLMGGPFPRLNSVFMDSDNDGWAVGENNLGLQALYRWNGYSWTQAPSVSPITSAPLFGVYMQGSSNAWAVGGVLAGPGPASTLYYDGNTWTGRIAPACACILNSIFMISGSESWAVGTASTIWHSTTQGGAFTISPYVGPAATFQTVFFDSSTSGWAGGTSGGSPIIVRTATDGADGWPTTFLNPGGLAAGYVIQSLCFQDFNHGWAATKGFGLPTRILYWNGVSWTQVAPVTTNPDDLYGISVEGGTPATDGWAVGFDTTTSKPVTIHYDGTTWTEMSLTPAIPNTAAPTALNGLFLRSSTNGLAVGQYVAGDVNTLALILHLDPPGGVTASATTAASTSSTSTTTSSTSSTIAVTSGTSSTSSVSTSTSSTPVTSASTSSTPTTVSTAVVTFTVASTPTTTTQAATTSASGSVSVPLTLPPIPGFPLESIIAGIIVGVAALVIVRRRRK